MSKKIILKYILQPHICHDANFRATGDITKTFSVTSDARFWCSCLENYIETLVWFDSMKYTKPLIRSVQNIRHAYANAVFRILLIQVAYYRNFV